MKGDPFVGKKLLVGVRFVDDDDNELGSFQTSGKIIRISDDEGVVISKTWNGKEFRSPPQNQTLRQVDPGRYRLRSGEVVVDPDFSTTWKVIMSDDCSESTVEKYKEHGYSPP